MAQSGESCGRRQLRPPPEAALTVEFTVASIPCIGLNGGPQYKHSEAFSFQIATDDQEETDHYLVSLRQLLKRPLVAIRVSDINEAAPGLLVDLTGIDTAAD